MRKEIFIRGDVKDLFQNPEVLRQLLHTRWKIQEGSVLSFLFEAEGCRIVALGEGAEVGPVIEGSAKILVEAITNQNA